jgi:hypothetical protein
MSLESEVCSVVWSLPLQLDTDTRQNLRALCMLSDAASDATVALVCTLFPTPDEESDAARTPSSQIVLCIPLDARGRKISILGLMTCLVSVLPKETMPCKILCSSLVVSVFEVISKA